VNANKLTVGVTIVRADEVGLIASVLMPCTALRVRGNLGESNRVSVACTLEKRQYRAETVTTVSMCSLSTLRMIYGARMSSSLCACVILLRQVRLREHHLDDT